VILVDAAGGRDGKLQAVVADLAAPTDGLSLGGLDLFAGGGEEPLGVLVAAGGPVQPGLRPVVLDHQRPLPPVSGGGGVAVGGAQRTEDLPHAALADADQAGQVGGGEALDWLEESLAIRRSWTTPTGRPTASVRSA
jgi:hypothetical protein